MTKRVSDKESTSALRTKTQTAENRYPQTQEKAAEKQTQEQIKADFYHVASALPIVPNQFSS